MSHFAPGRFLFKSKSEPGNKVGNEKLHWEDNFLYHSMCALLHLGLRWSRCVGELGALREISRLENKLSGKGKTVTEGR